MAQWCGCRQIWHLEILRMIPFWQRHMSQLWGLWTGHLQRCEGIQGQFWILRSPPEQCGGHHLAATHSSGHSLSVVIIHCVIKPEYITVVDGHHWPLRVELVDFGPGQTLTNLIPGELIHSTCYTSPEVMVMASKARQASEEHLYQGRDFLTDVEILQSGRHI